MAVKIFHFKHNRNNNNLRRNKMKTTIKIADRLIELMTLKGINNSTLAAEIGVSNVTVGRWVNGNNSFKLSNCLKLVNYFNCSLDFLTGRSDITIDFVPKNCPPLYNHIRQLMQKKGNIAQ